MSIKYKYYLNYSANIKIKYNLKCMRQNIYSYLIKSLNFSFTFIIREDSDLTFIKTFFKLEIIDINDILSIIQKN